MNQPLLEINNVSTAFRINDVFYNAIDGIDLTLNNNEILALVGESGSGKSTLATSIVGLHDMKNTKVEGEVIFKGENILEYTEDQYNQIRGENIGMIFQDPLGSLNPLMNIRDQIAETLYYHSDMTKDQRTERVLELLEQVQINNPEHVMKQYPHELSGGMRQRVMIAIALANKPDIIIADEPTTALDVTIQAQILDLMAEIQDETGTGIILITHDLGVVSQVADRVAVMYAGQIVELADVHEIFNNPKHPYTRSLLQSVPDKMADDQTSEEREALYVIQGTVPSLEYLPRTGCRFAPRIPWVAPEEHEAHPEIHEIKDNHFVRCTCWKHFDFENEHETLVEEV